MISFGNSFRVGIDENIPDKLVTSGMFAFTQNPLYLFRYFLFGQFLIHSNIIIAIALGFTIGGICTTRYGRTLTELGESLMLKSLGISEWKEKSIYDIADDIVNNVPRPLVLIDGKGGSGKTSLAKKLAELLGANIVETDDVCWWADPIHWDDEMIAGIIKPWLDNKNVAYKPSGWIKKNRSGSITVDSCKPLIIEGSGACRRTLRELATYSIWVDTEPALARSRVIDRDLANAEDNATTESVIEFIDWWDSVVDPFLAEEQAWKYVNVIISGTQSDLIRNTLQICIH